MSRTAEKANAGSREPGLAKLLWPISGFLMGTLLVWAFLVPVDATSVFEGSAQPQNLFWLLTCSCVTGAVVGTKQGYDYGNWQWAAAISGLVAMIGVNIFAGQECNGRTAWYGFWQIVSLAGAFYSARILLAGPKSRSAALRLILIGCIALTVHGLYQVSIEFPANRAQFEEDPELLLRLAGFDAPEGSAVWRSFRDRLYSPEPFATFALANSLAVLLSGGLILAIAVSVNAIRHCSKSRTPQTLVIASFAVAACALLLATWFLTRSRTGYLAVLIVLSLWALRSVVVSRRSQNALNWKPILIAGGLAALVISSGVLWLVQNDRLVLSEAAKSLLFRMEYWQASLAMLREHWTGIGFGNFQSYYPRYMLPTASETIADPHNWFLDMAVSLSLPCAILITTWLVLQFRKPTTSAQEPISALDTAESNAGDQSLSKSLLAGATVGGTFCLIAGWLLLGIDINGIVLAWAIALPIGLTLRGSMGELATHGTFAIRLAAGAMFLCLFASGSWQASGIAIPWLVLMVCSTPLPTVGSTAEVNPTKSIQLGRWGAMGLSLLGLCIFVFQSWMPTTRCWSLLQQTTLATSFNTRLELAKAAAVADPLDSGPLRLVAETLSWDAEENSTRDQFDRKSSAAIAALKIWLDADSTGAPNWQFAGDRLLKLAAQARDLGLDATPLLLIAKDDYAEATRRHSTSVRLHLQLAAVHALMHDKKAALDELQLAESLSKQTPHADKKLFAQQIWLPSAPTDMPDIANSDPSGEYVPGEPVAKWIRSL